ncbi:MAG: hypothetical protein IIC55_07650 [Proteobacteria bacterium]|nr:hypothetical protein [Pseudomonadota bacterium]
MARTSRKKAPKGNGTQKRNAKRNGPTLRGRMARIRNELSGLRVANGNGDLFRSTIEQLEALAGEIAEAADKVMTAGEAIQKSADTIAARTKDRTTKTHVNRIVKNTGDLFEACSFQDITGQRIGKITRTVGAIEDGFHCVATLAGGKGGKKRAAKSIDRIDGGIVLEGPQIDGPAVSQADIDKFFD